MRKGFGALLMMMGAVPLFYTALCLWIMVPSLGDIGCGQNPFALGLAALGAGVGLSLAFAGYTVVFQDNSRGQALLKRRLIWSWAGAGTVIVASFLVLPPCPFIAR